MLGYLRRLHPSTLALGAGVLVVVLSTIALSLQGGEQATRRIVRVEPTPSTEALSWVSSVPHREPPLAEPPASVPRQAALPVSQNDFIWPTSGAITQGMSATHPGVDVGATWNEPVRSIRAGTVTFVGGDPCCVYGNYVIVTHDDGWTSLYGHLNSFAVKEGDHVNQGAVLGLAGMTGKATGVHVHLELRHYGGVVNPLNYLKPLRYYVPPPVQVEAPTPVPSPTPTTANATTDASLAVGAAIGWMRGNLDEGFQLDTASCFASPLGLNWSVSCQTHLLGCDTAICKSSITACVIGSVFLVESSTCTG